MPHDACVRVIVCVVAVEEGLLDVYTVQVLRGLPSEEPTDHQNVSGNLRVNLLFIAF
jgi:hypothetical protein